MLWILDKLQMTNTRQLAEREIALLQEPEEEEEGSGKAINPHGQSKDEKTVMLCNVGCEVDESRRLRG